MTRVKGISCSHRAGQGKMPATRADDKTPKLGYNYTMKTATRVHFKPAALAASVLLLLAASCSRTLGWGVVLWPPEGSALGYGQAVPVYFKSNITQTYAVGVPGSKAKEELELWRMDLAGSKGAAQDRAAEFAPMAPLFAVVSRDGLILRDEPNNRAAQTYRLRSNETIKLLQSVEGEPVTTGGRTLKGEWYLAMADDGTRGYVFSNQLSVWDAAADLRPSTAAPAERDAREDDIFERTWRPDYFAAMEESGVIDLDLYKPRFGVFTDPLRNQIRVERPDFSKSYNYDRLVSEGKGVFSLGSTGATISMATAGQLVFTPPAEHLKPELVAANNGKPVSFVFVPQRNDPLEVIAAEERRRQGLLSALVADGELFESQEYGSLVITRSARITWAGHDALSPDIIPADSGDMGYIDMDLHLDPALQSQWQGAFTIHFDGGSRPSLSFLYNATPESLELAYLPEGSLTGSVVVPSDSLVVPLSFTRYR